jgi:hypothetical protein
VLSFTKRRVTLGLVLALTGCALPVNGIGKGHSPRIQAAVILLGAALETMIAVGSAQVGQRGEIVCRPKPDAGDGSLTAQSDCTTPFEYKVGAAIFGLVAGFDTGVAIYQLVSGQQAFERPYKPWVDPALMPANRRPMTAPAAQR